MLGIYSIQLYPTICCILCSEYETLARPLCMWENGQHTLLALGLSKRSANTFVRWKEKHQRWLKSNSQRLKWWDRKISQGAVQVLGWRLKIASGHRKWHWQRLLSACKVVDWWLRLLLPPQIHLLLSKPAQGLMHGLVLYLFLLRMISICSWYIHHSCRFTMGCGNLKGMSLTMNPHKPTMILVDCLKSFGTGSKSWPRFFFWLRWWMVAQTREKMQVKWRFETRNEMCNHHSWSETDHGFAALVWH